MISPNQLRVRRETVLRSSQQLKVQPTYCSVGTSYCLVSVSLTILIQQELVSMFSIAFATGASMAAVSQLFSTKVNSVYILHSIQLKCLWL